MKYELIGGLSQSELLSKMSQKHQSCDGVCWSMCIKWGGLISKEAKEAKGNKSYKSSGDWYSSFEDSTFSVIKSGSPRRLAEIKTAMISGRLIRDQNELSRPFLLKQREFRVMDTYKTIPSPRIVLTKLNERNVIFSINRLQRKSISEHFYSQRLFDYNLRVLSYELVLCYLFFTFENGKQDGHAVAFYKNPEMLSFHFIAFDPNLGEYEISNAKDIDEWIKKEVLLCFGQNVILNSVVFEVLTHL